MADFNVVDQFDQYTGTDFGGHNPNNHNALTNFRSFGDMHISANDFTASFKHLFGMDSSAPSVAPYQPPPSTGDVYQGQLQQQIKNENRMRSASTILTGGAGLLDTAPTQSAGRTLLGY